jgi:hypothetical protein
MKNNKLELDLIIEILYKLRKDEFYFKSYGKDILKSYIKQEVKKLNK